jgi:hypothetical protein
VIDNLLGRGKPGSPGLTVGTGWGLTCVGGVGGELDWRDGKGRNASSVTGNARSPQASRAWLSLAFLTFWGCSSVSATNPPPPQYYAKHLKKGQPGREPSQHQQHATISRLHTSNIQLRAPGHIPFASMLALQQYRTDLTGCPSLSKLRPPYGTRRSAYGTEGRTAEHCQAEGAPSLQPA